MSLPALSGGSIDLSAAASLLGVPEERARDLFDAGAIVGCTDPDGSVWLSLSSVMAHRAGHPSAGAPDAVSGESGGGAAVRAEHLRRDGLAYQSELADRVLADAGWVEVDCSSDAVWDAVDQSEADWLGEEPDGNQIPTAHQFYSDLYRLSPLEPAWFDELDFEEVVEPEDADGWVDGRPVRYLMPESDAILVLHRFRDGGRDYSSLASYRSYRAFLQAMTGPWQESYIYMGWFWHPVRDGEPHLIAVLNAMCTLGGMCVDIDRVETADGKHYPASVFAEYVMSSIGGHPELRPNYIMLSGTGMQLWYVFGQRIPLLRKDSPRRHKYQGMLRRLYGRWDELLPKGVCKVDFNCTHINHAFRAPGSPSKLGYPTRLFCLGGRDRAMVDPLSLSSAVGGGITEHDVGEWDQEAWEDRPRTLDSPATDKQLAYLDLLVAGDGTGPYVHPTDAEMADMTVRRADKLIRAGKIGRRVYSRPKSAPGGYINTSAGHHVVLRQRHRGLYDYTLERIRRGDSKPGTRYKALVGLAGLACNCGVPKAECRADMMALLDEPWAKLPSPNDKDRNPLRRSDVEKALRSYRPLASLRSRELLEKRLGWHYGPPAKRNGRTREEHLKYWARPAIETYRQLGETEHLPGRPKGSTKDSTPKGERIRAYAAAHPGENHSQIARALGVSRPTVVKWLKDV